VRHPTARSTPATALAAAVAVALLAGCSAGGEASPSPTYTADSQVIRPGRPGEPAATVAPGATATRVPARGFNAADVRYVRDMLQHHAQAIRMASLAPDRAADRRVAALAARVTDSQRPEVIVLDEWLRQRRQLRTDPDGHGHAMPGMPTADGLRQLTDARGGAFDRLFLTLMAAHHRGAVEMSNGVMTAGTDPQVQELAAEIGAGQAAELNRMLDVRRDLP
jgi:uncharacterized protein (DUF305 family)